MALVFLSGAIDLANKEYQNWKHEVRARLAEEKIGIVDPAGTFNYIVNEENDMEHRATAKALIEINYHGLKNCDFAIIALDEHTPSIGTPIELFMCSQLEIPHVVVWSGKRKPAYVYGLADQIVNSMDDAIELAIQFVKEQYNN